LELIVTILCAMSGALIGTAVAILLMFRKVRPPAQVELDTLRGHLRTAEASLAATNTSLENLRKQLAERDRSIHENAEELNEKQRQLGFAIAEAEKAAAERSAAEQKAREAAAEAAGITERLAGFEARLAEEKNRVVEQMDQQVASYQAQLDSLTAECAELKTKLGAELERTGQLTGQIAELQNDRQSAAKGIELLLMAQQNLSQFLKPVCEVGPNGNDGVVPVEAAVAG